MKDPRLSKSILLFLDFMIRFFVTVLLAKLFIPLLLIVLTLHCSRYCTYIFFTCLVSCYETAAASGTSHSKSRCWRARCGMALLGLWTMVMMAMVLGVMDRAQRGLNGDVVWIWERLRDVWRSESRGGNLWQEGDGGKPEMDNDHECETNFVDSLEEQEVKMR